MGCATSAPAATEPPLRSAGVSVAEVKAKQAARVANQRALLGQAPGAGASSRTLTSHASAGTLSKFGSMLRLASTSRVLPEVPEDPQTAAAQYHFYAIRDRYETLDEVSDALRAAGLESSNLVLAIDYTKSNSWSGKHSFGGRSLHHLEAGVKNPYMTAVEVVGKVLAQYDDDSLIPVFGFGDSTTTDRAVFPFYPDRPARGFEEVLARYRELTPRVVLAGPTNFAPAIEAAIQIVAQTRAYHILVIIADGQVTNRAHTEAAILRASEYPLSIILVGVGDGPWETMEAFDDSLPARKFDNFQFVNLTAVMADNPVNPEVAFAIASLMEIPEQYLAIRQLGYL